MKQIKIFFLIIAVFIGTTHELNSINFYWDTSFKRPGIIQTELVSPLPPDSTYSSIWCNITGLTTGSETAYSDAQGGCGSPYYPEVSDFICTRYLKFSQFGFDVPTSGESFPNFTTAISMTGLNISFYFSTTAMYQDQFINWNLLYPTSSGLQNVDVTGSIMNGTSFSSSSFTKSFNLASISAQNYYAQSINHDYFGWRGAFKYYDTHGGNYFLKIESILTSIRFTYQTTVLDVTPTTGTAYTKVNISFTPGSVLLNGNYGGSTSNYAILWKCRFQGVYGFDIVEARVLSSSTIQCWPTLPSPNTTANIYIQFHKNLDIMYNTGATFQFLEYCPGYPGNTCSGNGNCSSENVTCYCYEGWAPPNCSELSCVEGGYPVNCSFHGECNNQTNVCDCYIGYDGWDCGIDICQDSLLNCSGNGTCAFDPNHCVCNPENNGTYCEDDKCKYLDCGEHGTCVAGYCDCVVPWDGYYCEIDVCNGTFPGCHDHGTAFMDCSCLCEQGYDPPYCEPDLCKDVDCNNGTVEVTTIEDSNSGVPTGAVIGGAGGGAVVIGLVIFFIVWRYKHSDHSEKNQLLPVFNIDTMFGRDIFLSNSDRKHLKSHGMRHAYLSLEEILLENLELVQAILTDTKNNAVSPIHRAILYLFEQNGQAINLLKYFIQLEVASSTDPNLLFRGINTPSQLWSGYCHLPLGIKYLHDTINDPIYQLAKNQGVDDSNSPQTNISVNKYHLLNGSQMIFDAICRGGDNIPIQFRSILSYTRSLVEQKFPDYVHQSLGSFMILRYFTPALTAYDQFGIMDQEPLSDEIVRMLVLISQVLQKLTTGDLFGEKEEHMISLNSFIETNIESMSKYLDKISLSAEFEDEHKTKSSQLPKDVYTISLAIIHEYIASNHRKIVQSLDTIVQDKNRRLELTNNFKEVRQSLGKSTNLTSHNYF
ncbi:ras gtpase-activating protein [Anaeramoeba ignava]|uniref:Ras gtpase-activating protein n=1 Tax=Anaeramoeba ignava TaxID=1746090 RepID=A0A9Q0LME2_ANAIG|nr:ras gtpase-activating protein [Anaeramoeba ignava]